MKTIIKVLIILLIVQVHSQSKQGKVIYEKQILIDFSKDKVPLGIDELLNTDKGKTGIEYELKFTGEKASFEIVKSIDSDFDKGASFSKILGGGEGYHYYDKKRNLKLKQTQANNDYFLLTDFLTEVKWKITKDTMTIGNMICYKATSTKYSLRKIKYERPIVAWFTLDIPVSYGPIGYNGLPGLILDLTIQNQVRFYAKKIEYNKSVTIKEPTKGKKMTEEEYEIMGRKNYEAFKAARKKTYNNKRQ